MVMRLQGGMDGDQNNLPPPPVLQILDGSIGDLNHALIRVSEAVAIAKFMEPGVDLSAASARLALLTNLMAQLTAITSSPGEADSTTNL